MGNKPTIEGDEKKFQGVGSSEGGENAYVSGSKSGKMEGGHGSKDSVLNTNRNKLKQSTSNLDKLVNNENLVGFRNVKTEQMISNISP